MLLEVTLHKHQLRAEINLLPLISSPFDGYGKTQLYT